MWVEYLVNTNGDLKNPIYQNSDGVKFFFTKGDIRAQINQQSTISLPNAYDTEKCKKNWYCFKNQFKQVTRVVEFDTPITCFAFVCEYLEDDVANRIMTNVNILH